MISQLPEELVTEGKWYDDDDGWFENVVFEDEAAPKVQVPLPPLNPRPSVDGGILYPTMTRPQEKRRNAKGT